MKQCHPHRPLRPFTRHIRLMWCCLLLVTLWGGATHAEAKDGVDLANPYAIQLKLSSKPYRAADLPNLPQLAPYRLYTSTRIDGNKTWYRLRVGFFPSAKEATALNARLQATFPGAWVTRVSAKERQASGKRLLLREPKKSLLTRLFGKKSKAAVPQAVAPAVAKPAVAKPVAPKPARAKPAASKPAGATVPSDAINLDHRYAIQLRLSTRPSSLENLPKLPEFTGRRLYETHITRRGESMFRLRLGFFETAREAQAVQKRLTSHFPDAWITNTATFERKASAQNTLGRQSAPQKAAKSADRGKRGRITVPVIAAKPGAVPGAVPGAAKAAKPGTVTKPARKQAKTPKKTRPAAVSRVDLNNAYTLQLMLSSRPIDPDRLPALPAALRGYRLYVAKTTLGGKPRYVLRLGFFASSREAGQYQSTLEPLFKGNWVTRVSEVERRNSFNTRIVQGRVTLPPTPRKVAKKQVNLLSPAQEKQRQRLMTEGRAAITKRDYNRAIQVFTKLLAMPTHPQQADAQEFLGLSRERNGQLAHAKAEYRRYLANYPDGESAVRVRQRLAGLMTAAKAPSARLRSIKTRGKASTWRVNGGFSQYYRYDVDVDQNGDDNVLESSLSTNVDLNIRRRGGDLNLRSRFSGDYRYDLLNPDAVNRGRITTMYVDASHRSTPWSGRVGRMTQTSGGVLGRYDGFTAGHRLTPQVQVNLVAGFPVDFSTAEQINTDKKFIGLNTDLGTFAAAWDVNLFVIQQTVTGVVDRRAAGAEVRYFKVNRSLFTLLDYDFMFGQLNTALLLGNLTLPDKSTLNLTVDIRKSPVLSTGNALQGQPVFSLNVLTALVGNGVARDLAKARTATSRTITLGGTHPFNERVQLNMDLTVSKLSGTPGSAPVLGIPGSLAIDPIEGTGQEYFFNTQLIINRLLRDNDVSIIGARFANTSAANTSSLSLNTRYPAGTHWRINPRIRADYRNNNTDSSTSIAIYPTLRADYRIGRVAQLEIQTGGDWTNHSFAGNSDFSYGYFASLGYRMSF